MHLCRICNARTQTIFSFGRMPIANGFLKRRSDKEFFYPLALVLCPRCFMVQLREVPPPEMMFNRNYAYVSSTSKYMERHFSEVAKEIIRITAATRNPFVVELGSNDGIMLKHLAKRKVRHLGIEPATNVARISKKSGVAVVTEFFTPELARLIVGRQGQADVIFSANTLLSIEDINSAFEGTRILLKNEGRFIFEDPYLLDIVKLGSFDQIYDEHIYYFSGLSVREIAQRHGMELVDMKHESVHGGSMRYVLQKTRAAKISGSVTRWIKKESRMKLNKVTGFRKFSADIRRTAGNLKTALKKLRRRRVTVVGYGATSKSTTILNLARIGPELVSYISDNTPGKIGKFTPGMHIPIRNRSRFLADCPPYTLLFAWNHKQEILKKEKAYRKKGGKFITYFPKVKIE